MLCAIIKVSAKWKFYKNCCEITSTTLGLSDVLNKNEKTKNESRKKVKGGFVT